MKESFKEMNFFGEGSLFSRPKAVEEIAIAHDYLTQKGGAERVVLSLHKAFPEAKIYTTLYDPDNTYPEFKNADIVVSCLNNFKIFRENHRLALPILPFIASNFHVPADKTIISSTGWAHGFKFSNKTLVYCHSPARWLYLGNRYLGKYFNKFIVFSLSLLRPFLIVWDKKSAYRAGKYIANSNVTRERIYDVYGKESSVIFPPYIKNTGKSCVSIKPLEKFMRDKEYFLLVSRLLPYKNVDKVIEAFNCMEENLLIVGAGPIANKLKLKANKNIQFVSNISDAELQYAYSHCKALLAVSHEDFGLTPLEAGSWGRPTIALRAGGYLDTVEEGINGYFMEKSTPDHIRESVLAYKEEDWDENKIKKHIDKFSEEKFILKIKEEISKL